MGLYRRYGKGGPARQEKTIRLVRRLVTMVRHCDQPRVTRGLELTFQLTATNRMRRYTIRNRIRRGMMNNLSFEWAEPNSLAAELCKPIKQVFLEFGPHGRPIFVTLWRSDGTGLRLHSEMHDVAERKEVGVLKFSRVFAPPGDTKIVGVPAAFDHEISVSKLIIQESGTSAESGVILEAGSDEIVAVAGAYPYSLAVRGVTSVPHIFEPEYPIELYTRVPLP